MNNQFSLIEYKINQFIKKYYLNQLLKGLILFSLLFIFLSFILIILEYYAYLSINNKSILLLVYLIILFSSFIYLLILPLLGFLGLNITLNKQTINQKIVKHFPEIKDKLWNLLELHEKDITDLYSKELVIASIDQKIEMVNKFQFSDAISFKENLKFSVILFFLVIISTTFVVIWPNIFTTSTNRLKNFNTVFIKPSPFSFDILNQNLTIGKGDGYKLLTKVSTNSDYSEMNINYGGNSYLMKRDSVNHYSYSFSNVNNNINFSFSINEYRSQIYQLQVLAKPILSSFKVNIVKPKYTLLKNENLQNITEFVVPSGSNCTFSFNTYETDSLIINENDRITVINGKKSTYNTSIKKDTELVLSIKNKNFYLPDIISIKIKTINDQYPAISVEQFIDSIDYSRVFFRGIIEDDYGFKGLKFITKVNNQIDSTIQLQILYNLLQQNFFYAFNFELYKGIANRIDYYFQVDDNDAIAGTKSSISQIFTFSFPDSKEIFDYQDEQYDNIEELLSKSMNMTDELKKDLEQLKFKLLNSDLTEWEKRETIKNIYSKKQDLESALQSIRERNEELSNYMESFTDQNKDVLEKQQMLQSMLEEIMSDELKKLMEEFNKMMDNVNQNLLNELKEQIDISLDDLSKQLDRNIEMLKKMKIEQQLNMIAENLQKHIEKQQELADRIDEGQTPESLIEDQKKEKDALDHLKDQYDKVQEINKELENPLNLFDFENEFDKIDEEFNKSLDQQEKGNKSKSQQSMQKNKRNMQNLAFMMQQMMDAAFAEQNFENLSDLLQLLDNLIVFSFNQEELLVLPNNPEFHIETLSNQKKLYTDFSVIKDSLYALAKREPSVNMFVNKEIVSIETNFRRIDRDLTEGLIQQTKINQQMVMTSANNLALFMSEVINNLQQQMANSMPGNQNCQKPGNNPNPSSMGNSLKSMQQSLQQQLEKMMQMMKDGKDGQQMGGEMGKALAQQEKMQSMLQKMMNQGSVGSGAQETLKQAEQLLDRVREDIIRNNISDNTIKRQQQIMTRLLEAENAENERDQDEKRKSTTAEQQRISETAKYFDNLNSNDKFEERLIRQKLMLKRFYQQKFQSYVNQLDSINGN